MNDTIDNGVLNITGAFIEPNDGELRIPTYIGLYIAVSNTFIFTTGTVFNFLVIAVLLTSKEKHNPINSYLVNLGVADLCVLFVCQPVALMEYFNKERWILGTAVCKLVPVLESTVQHASSLTVLAIAFERMGAVCRPIRAFTTKQRRNRVIIPLIWMISVSLASPFAAIANTMEVHFMNGSVGRICHVPLDLKWKRYFVVGGILFFFLLVIVMTLMNIQIIRKLRASEGLRRSSTSVSLQQSYSFNSNDVNFMLLAKRRSLSRQRNSTSDGVVPLQRDHHSQIKMLVFIVLYLIVSYMPMRVFILWQMYTQRQPSDIGVEKYLNLIWLFRMLIYLHSASNPFIYSFMSSKFMKSFWRLVNYGKGKKSYCIKSLLLSQVSLAMPGYRMVLLNKEHKEADGQ